MTFKVRILYRIGQLPNLTASAIDHNIDLRNIYSYIYIYIYIYICTNVYIYKYIYIYKRTQIHL